MTLYMTPYGLGGACFFHSSENMDLSTTVRLGNNVIRIPDKFDNVLNNFEACASAWDPNLIISDASGRRLVLSSSKVLEILSAAVKNELEETPPIQEPPVGHDRPGFKTKSGAYGILLEDRGKTIVYRILQECNGIYRQGFRIKGPKTAIEEWQTFTSLGDGEYIFAPPSSLPPFPPVEEEKYPLEVGSIVAVWGKHNKLWFYKLTNLNPFIGSYLFPKGGQTFEERECPYTEELDDKTFLYLDVPHKLADGKYRITKAIRRKCMSLMRESIRKTAE